MAELPKVLYDDHQRLERMFSRYTTSYKPELVAGICDEIELVLTTYDELAMPLVGGLNSRLGQVMTAEHERIRDLVAQVQSYDPGDPEVKPTMKRLERALLVSISHSERDVLPLLRSTVDRGELHDLGRQAFTVRQEILANQQPRPRVPALGVVGSGWNGGRASLDAGW